MSLREEVGEETRRLTSLAIPVVVTQVSSMLLGVVDILMVGRVGVEALGAASLGRVWVFGTLLLGMGLVLGIDPLVSQGHGRRDARALGLALQRGLVLALLASLPTAGLWLLAGPGLRFFGQDPALARAAAEYVMVQLPSIPFFLGYMVLKQYLQGRAIVRPAMYVALLANLFNVVFNWALIYGHLGSPALGLLGAGIATSLARIYMMLGLLFIIYRTKLHQGGWVPWSRASFRWAGLAEIIHYGYPVAIQIALEMWAFQAATLLSGRLGAVSLAAHTVVINVASLTFMFPLGISLAGVTRVGNLIGEGFPRRAQHAAWLALAMSAAVMAVFAALFIVLRDVIPRIYTQDAPVVLLAAAIFPVAAAFQVFDGVQVAGTGVLRGMGKTRPAAAMNLVGYWALGLPLGWWLAFRRGLGLAGLWWGLVLGLGAVAVMLTVWIWKRGPARVDARVYQNPPPAPPADP